MLTRDIEGYRIRVVRVSGDGAAGRPNIFLVHGMVDSSDTWESLWPGLEDCNVWAVDLPWSGREGVTWPHVMTATEWWRAALALCPVRPSICIGHSFGAAVLLDWAAGERGPAADGLVLLSPLYCAGRRTVGWSEIDSFARDVPKRLGEAMRVRFRRTSPPDSVLAAMAHKLVDRVMPDAMLELFRLFLKSRACNLAQLDLPLLVTIGERDGALTRTSFADLQQACCNFARAGTAVAPRFKAAFHELRDCGHYPMHEQPQLLLQLLTRFVRSVTGAQTATATGHGADAAPAFFTLIASAEAAGTETTPGIEAAPAANAAAANAADVRAAQAVQTDPAVEVLTAHGSAPLADPQADPQPAGRATCLAI